MLPLLKALFVSLVAIATFAVLALLFALPVMWLSNALLSPALLAFAFGGKLTVLRAFGVLVLARLFFGGNASVKS